MATTLPRYSVHERDGSWHVLFRLEGRQVKRRIGPAHKRGRPRDGALNRSSAEHRAREIVAEQVVATTEPESAGPTFRAIARDYLPWLERVRGAKPSTLADHRYVLAEPNGRTKGLVTAAIGDRPADEITGREIEDVLEAVAATGGPRTFNKYRAVIVATFSYGVRRAGLTSNPAKATDKRREPQGKALDTFTVNEVEQLAQALANGVHRDKKRRNDAEIAEDHQDAELVRVAAYTGLRQGELRALRWSDVGNNVLTVSRALSAGIESGTKGGRVRHVPLVPPAAAALERLRERGDFTAPDELVFVNWRGRALDPSALVQRFKRARDRAGLRPLRFHDLRHTYGSLLASAGVPVTDIQAAMGHADLQTTSRYLHARRATEQVGRFAQAFQ